MTVFTIKAKNKQQASKIKAALKLIDVGFYISENDDSYELESNKFYPEIEKSQIQAIKEKKDGTLKTIDPNNVWKSIGLQ
jgi:hypothetical protein